MTVFNPIFRCVLIIAFFLAISFSVNEDLLAQTSPPLRMDSVEKITEDLENYIPKQMEEDDVLGLSIALIRDGQIVWEKGFGLENGLTREPVTPETVFSVASNGKSVAAYLAMKQVEAEKMSLDKSLNSYLKTRWLPDSPEHNSITLRNVLTHTSGLSNFLQDKQKKLAFKPGKEFSYSGVGFMYLQEAIKQQTGESLDKSANRLVFEPLKMKNSYFSEPRSESFSYARGHISYGFALIPFSIIFVPIFVLLFIIGLIFIRIKYGHWKINKLVLAISIIVPTIATIWFLWSMAGALIMPVYFAFCFFLLILVWIGFTFLGVKLLPKLFSSIAENKRKRNSLLTIWAMFCVAFLLFFAKDFHAPLVDWFPAEGNAASSLRSTSGDLARFMIDFSEKKSLDPKLIEQMTTPQQKVNKDISWGLGIGIQHSEQGDSIWHWGSNPGSKSIMVYYPEQKIGVVVLTNSEDGDKITFDIAGRALGGKAFWKISSDEDEKEDSEK